MSRSPLPIDAVLPEVVAHLRTAPGVVVVAPTGSGKTTRLAPALLDAGMTDAGAVIVLEPRRIAARAAAQRVASERGGRVGDEVGYHVRFDKKSGPRTRIRYVTEGLFLRTLQADPFLEGIAAVVFDEFHERNLDGDLALALTRRVQEEARDDLRIVVMSATLDPVPVAEFLGGVPVVRSEGRSFPVEISYEAPRSGEQELDAAARVVRTELRQPGGDLLVFLPGVGEIRRLERELSNAARVVPLFGDLPPDKQDRALCAGGERRVVLATNVAETSVTVEGVDTVIDTGRVRLLRHDDASGLNRLVPERISRASADQRAGRAGRLGPGRCIRLWSEWEGRALPAMTEPEVRRSELSSAVLELLVFGEHDLASFPWFQAPRREALQAALHLLEALGAIRQNMPTALGRRMQRLPIAPRLARLMLEAQARGAGRQGALAAALLSERTPFVESPRGARQVSSSDILDRLDALEDFERSGQRRSSVGELVPARARTLFAVRDQLVRSLPRESEPRGDTERAVEHALFAAFVDRVARRRETGSPRGALIDGRGVRLDTASAVSEAELFVCIDMQADHAEARVRLASAVAREWLTEEEIEERTELIFDARAEKVLAKRQRHWRGLVLEERDVPAPRDEATAALLAREATRNPERSIDLQNGELAAFLARVRCLGEWCPELDLPAFTDDDILALLPELCVGLRAIKELRALPLEQTLRGRLSYEQSQALEREAPERLQVPSGPRIKLVYREGSAPVLAARIQQLFGWNSTPRIARGRVTVLLHLLAPNGRPQQVTDDLAGFWVRTYPVVRKELRRRYPKHAWPETPPTGSSPS